MERKLFLRRSIGFLGMAVLAPSLLGEDKADACVVANTETAGPFPTIGPSSFVRSNIIGTRTGVAFTININVFNINGCSPVPNVTVDIWHCDKDGNYSQYGGTGMQPTNYTGQDFLRGRQVTNANGQVSFTSIFPGWYTGRATHIHVHIYDSNGISLLISQIAFPEGTGSAVETVNLATSYGYTKGMTGYTYNNTDNVFSDGTSTEMSAITGSLAGGYTLNWDAYANAGTVGIDEKALQNFQIRQNYPNPCSEYSNVPLVLRIQSDVVVQIYTTDGKLVSQEELKNLNAGEHTLSLNVKELAAGKYIYTIWAKNFQGSFRQSKLFVVK